MSESKQDFSFKRLFAPLTTFKAIHIIIVVGFTVFFNCLFNGFVWDDKTYIISNLQVHQPDLLSAFSGNMFNTGGQYRPLQPLYWSFLYPLFSTNPFPYHLLQVILHIACAGLLYILFRKYLSPGIALFSALVFLVHPMNIESVSYIAQLASPVLTVFGLIPLFFVTKKKISGKMLLVTFFVAAQGCG